MTDGTLSIYSVTSLTSKQNLTGPAFRTSSARDVAATGAAAAEAVAAGEVRRRVPRRAAAAGAALRLGANRDVEVEAVGTWLAARAAPRVPRGDIADTENAIPYAVTRVQSQRTTVQTGDSPSKFGVAVISSAAPEGVLARRQKRPGIMMRTLLNSSVCRSIGGSNGRPDDLRGLLTDASKAQLLSAHADTPSPRHRRLRRCSPRMGDVT
jgi:hypothetical protein